MDYGIERSEVLRCLGYSGQTIEPDLHERLENIIERAQNELNPKKVIGYFGVDSTGIDEKGDHSIALTGTSLVLEGVDIYRHLHEARECALLACTLGAASEQELMRLGLSSPLDALMYDAACSALIERVADEGESKIVQYAATKNLFTNWRYSPGYGDLSLAIQPAFLRTLHAFERIGLSTTETNLLLPTKSITAIVGLFDQPSSSVRLTCTNCHMFDFCSIRSSGETCHG